MSTCGVFSSTPETTSFIYSDCLLGDLICNTTHFNFYLNISRNNSNCQKIVGKTSLIPPHFLFVMTNDIVYSIYRHKETKKLYSNEEMMSYIMSNAPEPRTNQMLRHEFTLALKKKITGASVSKDRLALALPHVWKPFVARAVCLSFVNQSPLRSKEIFRQYVNAPCAIAGVFPLVLQALSTTLHNASTQPPVLEHPNLIENILFALHKCKTMYVTHSCPEGMLEEQELERISKAISQYCEDFGFSLDLLDNQNDMQDMVIIE